MFEKSSVHNGVVGGRTGGIQRVSLAQGKFSRMSGIMRATSSLASARVTPTLRRPRDGLSAVEFQRHEHGCVRIEKPERGRQDASNFVCAAIDDERLIDDVA
jgi:hypothetical protein